MAATEKTELKAHLTTIQEWTDEQSVHVLQNTFFALIELEAKTNTVLWVHIKKALADSKALKDIDVRDFITRKDLSKKGYWWFNPTNWN